MTLGNSLRILTAIIVGFLIFIGLSYVFLSLKLVEPLSRPDWVLTLFFYGSIAAIIASSIELKILNGYQPLLQYGLTLINFALPFIAFLLLLGTGCALGGCNNLEEFFLSAQFAGACLIPIITFGGFYFISKKLRSSPDTSIISRWPFVSWWVVSLGTALFTNLWLFNVVDPYSFLYGDNGIAAIYTPVSFLLSGASNLTWRLIFILRGSEIQSYDWIISLVLAAPLSFLLDIGLKKFRLWKQQKQQNFPLNTRTGSRSSL